MQRAAVAGICEPRLLHDAGTAAAAQEACATATRLLVARPGGQRRTPDVRTLRQALGYCWSVVVAADPQTALPTFRALAVDYHGDRDVEWIVRENFKKNRLKRLLEDGP